MLTTRHVALEASAARISDTDYALRAAGGDKAAFEAIMRRHNQLLFRTARSILKNDADAEDALQEAYLHAWKALKNFRSDAKLSTWLVRIVVNESLGRVRGKSARIIPLDAAMSSLEFDTRASLTNDAEDQPEHVALRGQMRKLLEAHIDLLPEAFRTVLVLRAVEELTVEDVSHALDIPEATVRTRHFRAKGLLRASLAGQIDVALDDAFAFDGARCDRIVSGVLTRLNALR